MTDKNTPDHDLSNISIHTPPRWRLLEREATPEHLYWNRRRFLKSMSAAGLSGAGLLGLGLVPGCSAQHPPGTEESAQTAWASSPEELTGNGLYPASRNEAFTLDRPLTDPQIAGTYNNFYEFTTNKERVWELARDFRSRPWEVEVTGLIENPRTFDIDEIERDFPLEERLYRHRCVEAWAMAVPWTGFPLRLLLERVQPTSQARFVRFITVNRPEEMPGIQRQSWYPWPYYEGLTIEEAMNDLTLLTTGIYGRRLPPQHGAPVRIVTPWKYGYKSPKSIVRIELIAEQPPTFWNDLAPREYSFQSNVDPEVPHPRWSQASERMIGSGDRRPTLLYNGYGEWVADLYA